MRTHTLSYLRRKGFMFLNYEELFLQTIEDLRNKIASEKEYELVRAAGLCRHLLTDQHPLLSLANKKYRMPILFRVSSLSVAGFQAVKSLTMVWTSIIPNHLAKSIDVKLKDFLDIKFLKVENYVYTVKDIIRAASHCMGGIHSLKPKNEKEAVLNNLEKNTRGNHRTTFIAINSVCTVVLFAMEPLEKLIKANTLSK